MVVIRPFVVVLSHHEYGNDVFWLDNHYESVLAIQIKSWLAAKYNCEITDIWMKYRQIIPHEVAGQYVYLENTDAISSSDEIINYETIYWFALHE